MSGDEIERFVAGWIDAWNRRDVEAVLQHFSDGVQFTSPVATAVVGKATIDGKASLRAYWLAALERIEKLAFVLDHAVWDPERRELVIIYEREVDSRHGRACEIMRFDASGRVATGEAMYGIEKS